MSSETARYRGEVESEAHPDSDRTIASRQFFQIQRLVTFGHGGNPLRSKTSGQRKGWEAIRTKKKSQLPITGSAQERSLKVGTPIADWLALRNAVKTFRPTSWTCQRRASTTRVSP